MERSRKQDASCISDYCKLISSFFLNFIATAWWFGKGSLPVYFSRTQYGERSECMSSCPCIFMTVVNIFNTVYCKSMHRSLFSLEYNMV